MKVLDIYNFLNNKFPISLACDFDNVGLLIGDENNKVTKALVALDCSLKTVKDAVNKGCELIVTHHPIIFEPLKQLTSGLVPYELVKHNISVISMHTNLDVAEGGVNSCLCSALNLKNVEDFECSDGFIIKMAQTDNISAEDLASHIKTKLNGPLRFVDGGKPINNILVCSGSGANYIEEAILHNFDALITSEVKHHHFIAAANNNISLFDAGHFNTEDVVITPLTKLLKAEFSNIEFFENHYTDIKYK